MKEITNLYNKYMSVFVSVCLSGTCNFGLLCSNWTKLWLHYLRVEKNRLIWFKSSKNYTPLTSVRIKILGRLELKILVFRVFLAYFMYFMYSYDFWLNVLQKLNLFSEIGCINFKITMSFYCEPNSCVPCTSHWLSCVLDTNHIFHVLYKNEIPSLLLHCHICHTLSFPWFHGLASYGLSKFPLF